ncbi:MAG: hypothetical protein K9N52_05265 [Verrucomicrobia bacterium]|nr:hypothetical protein [Verrucomicrobiota bacterium]
MKTKWPILLLLNLAIAGSISAAPLNKKQIPSDAQWLIHIDLNKFVESQTGRFISTNILDKHLKKPQKNLSNMLGFDLNWRDIDSLTAWGGENEDPEKEQGVLIVKTAPNLINSLVGFAEKQIEQDPDSKIKKLTENSKTLYNLDNELYVTPAKPNHLLAGKSKSLLIKAIETLDGERTNLAEQNSFDEFLTGMDGIILIAAAQGLSNQADVPEQANVLKMANGGRILLAEKDADVCLDLLIKAKNDSAAIEMQQVFQGMIALFSLSQMQKTNAAPLRELLKSVNVSVNNKLVSVGLKYPVKKALEDLKQAVSKLDVNLNNKSDKNKTSADTNAGEPEDSVDSPDVSNKDKTEDKPQ